MNAMILTNNNSSTTVAAGGIIPLGYAVHGFGRGIVLNGNAINLTQKGYYKVTATISAQPTGATALQVGLYQNGVAISGAYAREAPAAAGSTVDLTIVWYVRRCCCDTAALTLVADSAVTILNTTVVVES